MVKLCASLLSLTLTTSLALAVPLPSYTDASDDLAARDPNIFGSFKHFIKDVGHVAAKGLKVAEGIAENPLVQAAVSVIPGGGALVAADKVIGTIRNVEKIENIAENARHQVDNLGGALRSGEKIYKAIRKGTEVDRKVGKLDRGIRFAKEMASTQYSARPSYSRHRRHHRRDLEDNEELSSRRDLDAEEFLGREYDDFLAERDFFEDLD